MRFLLVALLMICFSVRAEDSLEWYQGVVVLTDEEVVAGEVVVQPRYNIVLLRNRNGVKVYPACKIASVHYFDIAKDINRKFIVRTKKEKALEISYFYELVLQGELSLIREPVGGNSFGDNARDYVYYIIEKDEQIPLTEFKDKVLPEMMARMSLQLMDYITQHNLNMERTIDLVRLVKYYNQKVRLHPMPSAAFIHMPPSP